MPCLFLVRIRYRLATGLMSEISEFTLTMPDWALRELDLLPERLPHVEGRMREVIRFARLNFERDTGGPFAAGVFERDSGRVVTIGVNRVLASGCSSAHAEVMALSLAQRELGAWDLGEDGRPAHQLVVNWRPCAMCFGAVLWSGVRSLAIAGSGPELERLTGFDEGPVPREWRRQLGERGIEVVDGVLSDEAIAVFRAFRDSGAPVYNARGLGTG
jgi:tRNA(Arg) A34 adenosine deaminase TadA